MHGEQTAIPSHHTPRHGPPDALRVGMIFLTDPDSPTQLSGMPFRMAEALRAQGVEVVPLLGRDPLGARPDLSARIASRIRRERRKLVPPAARAALRDLFPGRTRRSVLRRARTLSERIGAQIDPERMDLLFGVCISTALFELETDLPIVYFSDATSRIINETYPKAAARGRARRDALLEMERTSLERVRFAAFAAPRTLESALSDLGVPPERTALIPMGAHVVPPDPAAVRAPADPPTVRDCRLLISAADPVRKRVDLAVRTAETLRARGVQATLSVIGPGTKRSRGSRAVESVGPLRLGHPDDAQTHRRLLRTCHLQLLPSLGEAYGIAPAESAHYARPAVVSDTGGLPSVVLHDQTGLVLPVEADHNQWADAITQLVQDPARYRRYSTAALARARDELNWSAWATSIIALMHQAITEPRASARAV
ncbi:MAG: glycosyltransferase family 4 protein [Phycisphaerales bacterium]|nr:glycosyltransferase family 4 protein [Planctomycetota bacterium]MCH8508498.1 glycosyltransferase family 4 protein [Phycisphaerales bacterium]